MCIRDRVGTVGMLLVAGTMAAFMFVDATTPIWVLLGLFFIQGTGMANVIPPATESIMSTLPRERAGVGSAVSNTIRQVGGALGVAVLGSVLASVFRNQMLEPTAALPAPERDLASESIAGSYGVAGQLGPAGGGLIQAANDAFVSGMHWAALGSSVVALLGAIAVLIWLPRRAPAQAPYGPPAASGEPQRELAEV